MDTSKVVVSSPAASGGPTHTQGPIRLRHGDKSLESRFLRALHEPPVSLPAAASALPSSIASQPVAAEPPARSSAEITALLERVCSALYVGNETARSQRVVLALDHVLPGAAAEIVREGLRLTVRLHARTHEASRIMSSQRDGLCAALAARCEGCVDVLVVRGVALGPGD